MTLKEMIYRRKSCRSYTGQPVDGDMLEKLLSFELKPLYPDIRVRMDIVNRDKVKCICPWTTPQLIAIYSEEAEGYLENAGFLFQQLELYLQTLGLGACWLGMGRMDAKAEPVEGMKFVILLAFGNPKGDQQRHSLQEFKRRTPEQMADRADDRLEPARLAPSAINSQPWYFTHEGEAVHAFRTRKTAIADMNRIDMGIALAQLYVANAQTFRFFRADPAPTLPGYEYTGSVLL